MSLTLAREDSPRAVYGTSPLPHMSAAEFLAFCKRFPDMSFERSAQGELIIMSPTGGETGNRNIKVGRFLDEWADRDGSGLAFDSSTLFRLPNGADRSPDASWVLNERWETLPQQQREEPAPLCPDFAVELMSPSDTLRDTQKKLDEYIANGLRLGLIIDRKRRNVHIYRPSKPVEILHNPKSVACDPELPGFSLPMQRIF